MFSRPKCWPKLFTKKFKESFTVADAVNLEDSCVPFIQELRCKCLSVIDASPQCTVLVVVYNSRKHILKIYHPTRDVDYDAFPNEYHAYQRMRAISQSLPPSASPTARCFSVAPYCFAATIIALNDLHAALDIRCSAGKLDALLKQNQKSPLKSLLLEYVPGVSALSVDGVLTRELAAQAIRGLSKLHAAGILHGHAQLEHVMAEGGRIWWVDFDRTKVYAVPQELMDNEMRAFERLMKEEMITRFR